MSNNNQNWEEDDFEFEDDEPTPAPQGNDLVKQLRKADRQKEKRIRDMEAELNGLRAQQRDVEVSRVLETEGVNPKIAKFIPADITNADAVKAWLIENSEVIGYNPNPQQSQQMQYADYESLENMDDVLDGAPSPGSLDNQYQMLNQVQTQDDLMRLIMGQD